MKIGNLDITNCKIGSVQVNEVRIGSTLVWAYSSFDPDAQAFITVAGITNPIQQNAINQLVLDLKGYSIWTKMKALYPFVGGTASQHKFNLKNPLDTDAAFRLTFFGGITHDSNGITGNETNGFFNTNLNDLNELALDDVSLWSYSRLNIARVSDVLFAVGVSVNAITINPRNPSNNYASRLHSNTLSVISNLDSRGFYGINRNNSANYVMQKNTLQNTVSDLSTGRQNLPILGFLLDGVYSQRNKCFGAIGQSLTNQEGLDFYSIVQAFQTTLSRNV